MLIDVAIPVPLHSAFTYDVPAEFSALGAGMRVRVPFRRKSVVAVVTQLHTTAPAHAKVKIIEEVLDEAPLVSPVLLDLCKWIADYYAAPIGEVLQAALPPHLWKQQKRAVSTRLPEAQTAHVRRGAQAPITLNAAQAAALAQIQKSLTPFQFAVQLLHGVTGSGKTEVYLAACADVLAQDRQAIVMVPEIALTPQLLGRFAERFGDDVAITHSGLTEAQRLLQWRRIQTGAARIVIGTRSALFAPAAKLGLIIIDEEHDSSYKQDDSPRYHGRDAAIMRAKMENIPVVLGSATPSLESFHNARQGKYQLLTLAERSGGQAMPEIRIVDMRELKEKGRPLPLLSPQLSTALQQRLDRGEQGLLLINRRGFARFVVCEACGFVATCPNCDLSLTFHQEARALLCHYCDYHIPAPDTCTVCKSLELTPVGAGAERIFDHLQSLFPAARIGRLDSDTIATQHNRTQILQDMHDRNLDILVGTQMIAKGHDFSHVTLVGIVSAEATLNLPDFRAAERSFQLLMQASGRAGRAHLAGEVIVQTLKPEHYCLTHLVAHDYTAFAEAELMHRESLHYPPWGRLINCTISSNVEQSGIDYANSLAEFLRQQVVAQKWRATLLGPAPALLYKLRGKTRMQVLLKVASPGFIPPLTRAALAHDGRHAPSGVQLTIDVDPLNVT